MIVRPLGLAIIAALIPFACFLVPIWFVPLVDAFLFGLLLAGYLAWRHQVESIFQLAGVVVVSVIAFVAALMTALPLLGVAGALASATSTLDASSTGRLHVAGGFVLGLASAVGASIVAFGFLAVIPGKRISGDMFKEIGVTAAAGAAITFSGAMVSRPSDATLPMVMFMMWHAGIAFVLGVQTEPADEANEAAAPVRLEPTQTPPPSQRQPIATMVPASGGSRQMWIVLAVLVGLYVVHSVTMSLIAANFSARESARHAAWLAEAPTSEGLPPLTERPRDAVFIAEAGELRLEGTGSVQRPGRYGMVRGAAIPPDQLEYFATYNYGPGTGSPASVAIWDYPSREWARYETRHIGNAHITQIEGQSVLKEGLQTHWLSGTVRIRVTGDEREQAMLTKAYLEKYPSDIRPDFPLFPPSQHR